MARDTGADWQKIEETKPWYGVLSAPEFLTRNLTKEAKQRFYAQGKAEMAEVVDLLTTHFGAFAPKTGVDFGSGMGRLTFAMAEKCEHVYGLDISSAMRDKAQSEVAQLGVTNVTFVPALEDGIAADWINSYIVFQHILPRSGYEIIRGLLNHLQIGGVISLQITFAHDLRDNTTLLRDLTSWRFDGETLTTIEERGYEVGAMSMYDYDMNRILMYVARAGVRNVFMRHTDHGGVHGFWILVAGPPRGTPEVSKSFAYRYQED